MSKIKLKIYTWPEKILRKKCKRVKKVDDKIRGFFDEMLSLMRVNAGVGLAANQAGLDLKLIVIETNEELLKLVNPRIVKGEGKLKIIEGCLSFPGLEIEVARQNKIWVEALNERGEAVNFETQGVLAIILQHEIDHLNGVLFIDRIPAWRKLKILPRLRAIKKINKNKSLLDV